MRQEAGFTLIELVVVIVILGILAAFAVPRFVGMQDEARTSTLKGLEGSIRGAASLAHGKLLANGTTPQDSQYEASIQGEKVLFEGNSTWPAATSDGIGNMIQDTSGFNTVDPCVGNATGNCITYVPEGVGTSSSCFVTYQMNPGGNSPSYNSTTDNCS